MRRLKIAAAGFAALALLVGCSNGGTPQPDPTTDGATTQEPEADETTGGDEAPADLEEITVGVMPIGDTAAIWLGVAEGFFEEEGLDVNLEIAQGGAAIVPAVISGDYQFGFSNTVSLFVATKQGLPLKMLTPGAATTGDTSNDISGVLTLPDSGIKTAADLAGKTVAVNTLKNIGDVTVSEVVEAAGGDPDAVNFVEMGFPDMPAALSSGQVDAIWVLEPFLSIAKGQGAEVVTYNFAETDPDLLIAAYFATEDYINDNPGTVDAFVRAMTKSLEYSDNNPDAVRHILSTYTEIDDTIRESLVLPAYPSTFNIEANQKLADLALKHGLVADAVDVTDIIR